MAIFTFILWGFIGCQSDKVEDTTPPPLYPQPKVANLDTTSGYTLNPLTQQSIYPIINTLGDTIQTGISLPIKGKSINITDFEKPVVVPYTPSNNIEQAHHNIHPIPQKINSLAVKPESLAVIHLPKISQNDTVHYLINSIGDTLKTGIPLKAEGQKVSTTHPQPIQALPPRFKDNSTQNLQYLDVDQGMASSYVLSILEDQNGNIWFGTYGGGVSKYNAETFTHYTEKEGLSNDYVFSILEDRNGNLWFGTDGGGVSMFNGENFTHFNENSGLSNNHIWSILEDKKGNLWFGTDGGGVSKYNGQFFTHYTEKEGLSNNYVMAIFEDSNGNIWFGTDGGGVCKFDGKSFTHITEINGLPSNNVMSFMEDKKGNLWFGSGKGGVCRYNRDTLTIFSKQEGLSDNNVWTIFEDHSGQIWFGTYGGGANLFTGESFVHFTEEEGLSNNYIWSIFEDSKHNFWFCTGGGGVVKYKKESFTHLTEKEGLSIHSIWSIIEDKKGQLWLATDGEGINIYNGKTIKKINAKNGLPHNIVISLLKDKNDNIWIGTDGGGVFKFDGEKFTCYTEEQGLTNNYILSILEDEKGNLWFGTDGGGVSKFDGQTFTNYTEEEGLSSNVVRTLTEDANGHIWFGTTGGGLSRFDGTSIIHFTEKEGLSSQTIKSILEDEQGNLWLGTDGHGAIKFDGNSFTYFTEKEGLSNNVVWSIMADKQERIWMSTENGLNQLKQTESGQYQIYRYLKNDGLKGLDFYGNSVYLDQQNNMWWGSGKSLTKLNLNHFENENQAPEIHLTQLDINEQYLDYRNLSDSVKQHIQFDSVRTFENYPLNLSLPYHKNHLTFHFAAIDWSAPHKLKYSYLLEGQNSSWSQPSAEAKADYRNLSYGTYIFKVRAIGNSQKWSAPFEYAFTIQPPWWHTWYARFGYGVLFIFLFYFTLRWRTLKLKKRQKELENEVNVATKEIREQKEVVELAHQETKKQKEAVEEAHNEIKDSIKYAKRIQNAIMPPLKLFKSYLPKSFILYKPKDVVAGDFYWLEQQDNLILFAAADCTGHGVPGALVSVVCNNGLNRSVREHALTDPGKILDKTRDIVISEFEKSEEEVKDGMDISLCQLDPEKRILKWAGANNPIWLINPNRTQWPEGSIPFKNLSGGVEIKPNKQPIGKVDNPQPFNTHTLQLDKGDTIYIFSDGYQDQFGGEKGKKFKPANLKKLLLSIQDKPMTQQQDIIEATFMAWKNDLEQVDDVCVIGVKI
ncbi:MAG: two-component regulator propeller domain-containing protein [Putridiphycobacter sp.]